MVDEPASRPAAAFETLSAAMRYEAREVFRISGWSPPLGGGLGGALEHAGTPSRRGQGEPCVKPAPTCGRRQNSSTSPTFSLKSISPRATRSAWLFTLLRPWLLAWYSALV